VRISYIGILILLIRVTSRHSTFSCETKLSYDVHNSLNTDSDSFLLCTLQALNWLLLGIMYNVFCCINYAISYLLFWFFYGNGLLLLWFVKCVNNLFLCMFFIVRINASMFWEISVWWIIMQLRCIFCCLTILKFGCHASWRLLLVLHIGI